MTTGPLKLAAGVKRIWLLTTLAVPCAGVGPVVMLTVLGALPIVSLVSTAMSVAAASSAMLAVSATAAGSSTGLRQQSTPPPAEPVLVVPISSSLPVPSPVYDQVPGPASAEFRLEPVRVSGEQLTAG